jgi:hypothetical protein
MSALATQSANLVRQKLYNASGSLGGSNTRSSAVFYAVKALFLHLAANKRNPDLELKVLTNGANATIVGEACTLWAIIAKKGTVATNAYLKVSNHATQVQADSDVILESSTAGEEFVVIYPDGHPFGTGITAGSYTAYDGSNATTPSTATHNFYGFLIVGA